ncbi:MAG TPA: hypothetical protein VIF63_00040 [Candidatus Limnocylindrales bacterium]
MTGTGDGRGGGQRGGARPGRDRERGGDRYRAKPGTEPFDSTGWSTGASIEELPTVRLPPTPLGGTRLGPGGMLAVAGTAVLLAAGFGMLGGRAGPSPSPATGAVVPTQPPVTPEPAPTSAPIPQVTPFSDCAPPTTSSTGVQLQVNGQRNAGAIQVIGGIGPLSAYPIPHVIPDVFGSRISVPIDVISELWVVGGACALSWNIGLVDGDVLDAYETTSPDPAVAAQNRFALNLAPYAGTNQVLRADLYFSTLSIRVVWPIHVEAIDRPVGALQDGEGRAAVVEGCDVVVTFGNGAEVPAPATCYADLPIQPTETLTLDRDQPVRFWLGDWQVTNGVLVCGHLSDTYFVTEPTPGCFVDGSTDTDDGSITFDLPPDFEGRWTIGLAACAQSSGVTPNRVCGTWFADVRFRP